MKTTEMFDDLDFQIAVIARDTEHQTEKINENRVFDDFTEKDYCTVPLFAIRNTSHPMFVQAQKNRPKKSFVIQSIVVFVSYEEPFKS